MSHYTAQIFGKASLEGNSRNFKAFDVFEHGVPSWLLSLEFPLILFFHKDHIPMRFTQQNIKIKKIQAFLESMG